MTHQITNLTANMASKGAPMRTQALKVLAGIGLVLTTTAVSADEVRDIMRESSQWLVAQRQSQERVDGLAKQTEDTDAEYQRILRQIEGLEAYNRQLQVQVSAQEAEIARTDASISKATEVDRQLLPLLNNMVDTYATLVEVSPPFLPVERADSIAFLNEVIDRADVPAAEKFRQVLAAYMTEMGYGSTIEAYESVIRVGGGEREVNVLRLGRIGLYYQSADRQDTGMWDHSAKQWVELDASYRTGIYQAIRVASKLTAPSLLNLPLPPPQAPMAAGDSRFRDAQPADTNDDPYAEVSTGDELAMAGAGQ